MGSKVYYKALRSLPEDWISDDLGVKALPEGVAIAAHPDHKPMIWKDGTWGTITLEDINKYGYLKMLSERALGDKLHDREILMAHINYILGT